MVSQQSATISLPQAPKTCKGCGQCCIGLGVDVYSSDDVPDHMLYIEDDQSPIMRQRKDGSCIALDRKTMTCIIYDRRPEVCRQFEHGGLTCRECTQHLTNVARKGRKRNGYAEV